MRSNLGGQGGPCSTANTCDEDFSEATPHDLYLRNVGVDTLGARDVIDLRVTNVTEYHAWNANLNGLRFAADGPYGAFGIINLLGPRSSDQPGYIWNAHFTFVELRFEFLTRNTRLAPLRLRRTYMSLYDLDTGYPSFFQTQVEAVQANEQARLEVGPSTELELYEKWSDIIDDDDLISFFPTQEARASLDAWPTSVVLATSYGVGKGIPASAHAQQQLMIS